MPAALVVRLTFWFWFLAAVAAGYFLVLQRLAAPALPAIIIGLTAAVLYAYFRFQSLREWVDSLDLRTLVLLHLTRFVGIAFLVLYRRGELPFAFAVPGGIGDILVAAFALPVALAPLEAATRLRAVQIWNVVGFADILLVVSTAVRLTFDNPMQMRALTYLPLSLLPTFLVPLIIATHIVIFVRVAQARNGQ